MTVKNWITTIGGCLGAVGLAVSQVPGLPDDYKMFFAVLGAAGVALSGIAAKDFNVHSTSPEVKEATKQEIDKVGEWGRP